MRVNDDGTVTDSCVYTVGRGRRGTAMVKDAIVIFGDIYYNSGVNRSIRVVCAIESCP